MERIKRKSFHKQDERKLVLEAIRYVDEVIIFDEDTPLELIKKVKPYMITKGGDYEPEYVVGRGLALIKIFDTVPGESSTKILEWLNDKT
jgi:D-beta-D-heptose 7-phosphate kinase/D-beta-D-heptose 1-phosphate adenosyltransferase